MKTWIAVLEAIWLSNEAKFQKHLKGFEVTEENLLPLYYHKSISTNAAILHPTLSGDFWLPQWRQYILLLVI